MYIQEWDEVTKELGESFVGIAQALASRAHFQRAVHPCGFWDGQKMFMAVMLGPFEDEQLEELDRLQDEGLHPFYTEEQTHVRIILDMAHVRLIDGHGGVKSIDIK